MSAAIIFWSVFAAQIMLGVAILFTIIRMVAGPRAQDRVLALDAFYLVAMLLLLCFGIQQGTAVFFEVALIIGILGFVGTVALAKFLMRGEVIE